MAGKQRRDTHVTMHFGPEWHHTGTGNAWYATNELGADGLKRIFGQQTEDLAQSLKNIKLGSVEHPSAESGDVTGISMLIRDANGEMHDLNKTHRNIHVTSDGEVNAHHFVAMANGHALANQDLEVDLSDSAGNQEMVNKLRELGALPGKDAIMSGVERIDGETKNGKPITNYSVPRDGPIGNTIAKIASKGAGKGALKRDYSDQFQANSEGHVVIGEQDYHTVTNDLIKAHEEHIKDKPMSGMSHLVTTMVTHSKEPPTGQHGNAHFVFTTDGAEVDPLLQNPPDTSAPEQAMAGMLEMEKVTNVTPIGK